MTKAEFKDIFDTYFDSIRGFVYYRTTDEDGANDIAQDVFMRLWEKRDSLDGTNIKPLLYKMANDMVISHYRKQCVRLNFAKNISQHEASLSPHEELQFEELRERYALILEQMPVGQREVFLMNREESLKYSEIAERLGISVKAIEKRMSAALKFLKSKLL